MQIGEIAKQIVRTELNEQGTTEQRNEQLMNLNKRQPINLAVKHQSQTT